VSEDNRFGGKREGNIPAKARDEPARGSGIRSFLLMSSVNIHCSQATMAEMVALLHRQESFVSPQVYWEVVSVRDLFEGRVRRLTWMAWFAGSHED